MKTNSNKNKLILGGVVVLAAIFVIVVLISFLGEEDEVKPASITADDWPIHEWKTSTPEEQGVDSAKLAEALLAIQEKGTRIHSLLIVRNGRLLLDAYFYPYDGSTGHDMASVTKSMTGILTGIAVDQGKLKLDDPMLSFFPEIKISNPDPLLEKVTVRDLVMMANGLESTGMGQDEATLAQMESSDNWLQFAVDRRMQSEPGKTFVYDSPGMHILSGIIQKATGMTELEFARQNLLAPLGIQDVIWPADPQGHTHGFGNIILHPRDAAKIGYLMLNQGVWDGKQIVSKEWVEATFKTQVKTGMDEDYSYGWWIDEKDGKLDSVYAIGRGGQFIKILPFANTVMVVTGSGMDFDEIDAEVVSAVVDLENPLPPNPEGVAKLNEALQAIQQPPPAQPVPDLPEMAKTISGKTYHFEPNPTHIRTIRFDFDDSAGAGLEMTYDNAEEKYAGRIGLDGVLRMMPGEKGLPAGARGRWQDGHSFLMDLQTIGNRESFLFVITFSGDQIKMEIRESSHQGSTVLNGTAAP